MILQPTHTIWPNLEEYIIWVSGQGGVRFDVNYSERDPNAYEYVCTYCGEVCRTALSEHLQSHTIAIFGALGVTDPRVIRLIGRLA